VGLELGLGVRGIISVIPLLHPANPRFTPALLHLQARSKAERSVFLRGSKDVEIVFSANLKQKGKPPPPEPLRRDLRHFPRNTTTSGYTKLNYGFLANAWCSCARWRTAKKFEEEIIRKCLLERHVK
jgi:hypothetical protein